jgi:hypothetical protein
MGNPYLSKEEQSAIRMKIIEKALYTLTIKPETPTVFYPEYGNTIGNQTSTANPDNVDFDWMKL